MQRPDFTVCFAVTRVSLLVLSCKSINKIKFFSSSLSSDDGSSSRRARKPRGRPGRSAAGTLGNSARPQRLSLPGQVPDPLQAGRQQWLEGSAFKLLHHFSAALILALIRSSSSKTRLPSSPDDWRRHSFDGWLVFNGGVYVRFILKVAERPQTPLASAILGTLACVMF